MAGPHKQPKSLETTNIYIYRREISAMKNVQILYEHHNKNKRESSFISIGEASVRIQCYKIMCLEFSICYM